MKSTGVLSIFLILIFLTACSGIRTVSTDEKGIIKTTDTTKSNVNSNTNVSKSTQVSANAAKINVTQNKTALKSTTSTESTAPTKIQIGISQSNITLQSNRIAEKWIKGVTHTIEVVDVTDDQKGCMVKVDGTTTLIDEEETATINGVKIYVAGAYALKSATQDSDVCSLVIV